MPFFRDIPPLTPAGQYTASVGFGFIEKWLAEEAQHSDLQLDPDFQRGHVWNDEQAIRFVEYMLRGGKGATTIYWNHAGYQRTPEPHSDLGDSLLLVDGLQRLTAVRRFIAGEIPVFGHYVSEYEDPRRVFGGGGPHLIFNINNLQTRAEVLQWYLDLNAGGVVHSPEEILRVRRLLADELADKPRGPTP